MILPTKDRGPDVAPTLSALLEQDLPASDYEVVVVDNASRDENAAALRAWCAQHDRVARYVSEPTPGLNRARN
ncbi:MAG: glycosyltransferase family A protein, partial [Planctomycetota bacterium]|nr:glycosyltransferase family A protein [Planctomycetota bacterium]